MRKKQAFYGLVLLCAVLLLGVGYAAVTSVNLYINGTISTGSNIPLNVSYDLSTEISTDESIDSNATVFASYINEQKATIRVEELNVVDEWVSAKYAIHNEGDTTAEVSLKSNNLSDSEYFEVTTDGTKTVEPGNSSYVQVTVKLKKLPEDSEDLTTSIDLVLQADPVSGN